MPYNQYSAYSNLPVQPTSQPVMYQPSYMGMMQQPQQMPMQMNSPQMQPQQNQPNTTEQLNNGGFIVVANEAEVRRYPVAPGNFVDFRIENQPIIIEKSMSRSQFAAPQYVRYRLVQEDMPDNTVEDDKIKMQNLPEDTHMQSDIEDIKKAIQRLASQIDSLKDEIKKPFKNNNERKPEKKDGDRRE